MHLSSQYLSWFLWIFRSEIAHMVYSTIKMATTTAVPTFRRLMLHLNKDIPSFTLLFCTTRLFYGASCQICKIAGCSCAGNAGNVFLATAVNDPDMHHGTCVTHVPWCKPGLLTSGYLWRLWQGKRSQHSRHMRNPQVYASGKRPIACHRFTS